MNLRTALFVLAALAAAFLLREIWPKTHVVRTPPEIVTRWVTLEVVKLDTVEIPRWRTRVDTITQAREVVVTRVDTVLEPLPPTIGVSALSVPQEWGDSMIVRGFTLQGDSAGLLRREWRSNHFYQGPLSVLIADTIPPRVGFWEIPQSKECSFWCKVKIAAYGAIGGAVIWEIAR